jgi:vacuolar-type H+-ATPase subunit H
LFPPGRRAAWDDEMRELIRGLRDALSNDAKRSAAMGTEAESVLRRAQDEARRIVLEAEDHARRALEDGTLARAAEQQLQQIREQAVREADETRRGADLYAMTVLERLEREVGRILATVQRGKTVLSERTGGRAASAGNAPRLDNGKLASV